MHKHGGDVYGNENIIDFSANLNPLGMPERVKNAAKMAVDSAMVYPDVQCRELVSAISKLENTAEQNIICGSGAAELIFAIAFAVKPKIALLIAPSFEEYNQALTAVGCKINQYMLKEETGFKLEADFLELINKTIDIIFICNPNNPTGNVVKKELLIKIANKCKQNGVLLVVDECFNNFLEEKNNFSLKETEGTFVLKAFTKMYGMAGIRLGYGITKDVDLLNKIKACVQPWNVSVIAQRAGVAACHCSDFVLETKSLITKEKGYLLDNIKILAEKIYGSDGNFIFFKGEKALYENLLNEGIMIRDCSNFSGLSKGFYRIAVKNHEDNAKLINAWKSVKEE